MPLGKCSASVDRVTELSGVSLSGGSRPPRVPCRHQGGCTHRKSWPARKFNQTAGWVSLHSLPEMGMLSCPPPYGVPISPSQGGVSGGALCGFLGRGGGCFVCVLVGGGGFNGALFAVSSGCPSGVTRQREY